MVHYVAQKGQSYRNSHRESFLGVLGPSLPKHGSTPYCSREKRILPCSWRRLHFLLFGFPNVVCNHPFVGIFKKLAKTLPVQRIRHNSCGMAVFPYSLGNNNFARGILLFPFFESLRKSLADILTV